MMTTMAETFGIMPIAIGIGPGSEFRQPLGVAVVGGLVVSQVLTLFTIPVTYLYIERLSEWLAGFARRPRRPAVSTEQALVPAGNHTPPTIIQSRVTD